MSRIGSQGRHWVPAVLAGLIGVNLIGCSEPSGEDTGDTQPTTPGQLGDPSGDDTADAQPTTPGQLGDPSGDDTADAQPTPPGQASDPSAATGSASASPSAGPAPGSSDPSPAGSTAAPVGTPTEIDLLLVVDNSYGMSHAQALLGRTLPYLVERLVTATSATSLHLGVITTSLGGYASNNCTADETRENSEQHVDMAHLLASLPRGSAAAPAAAGSGFLSWTSSSDVANIGQDFANLTSAAGEHGCGWEATLESWVRFLIDPKPHTRVVRGPCTASDTINACAGPETDASGQPLVDVALLAQRAAFLRPGSLLTILMLSDENDCSFQPSGQSWILAETVDPQGFFNPAFKGTSACEDPAQGPNHECCQSCGATVVPATCATTTDGAGSAVAAGCESPRYDANTMGDHPNLRCFEQKRRFGIDVLLPPARYVNALRQDRLCSTRIDFAEAGCAPADLVPNPLYVESDGRRRPREWVFLAGLLGVPWQDLAIDPTGSAPLRLRSNASSAPPEQRLDWSWLLGPANPPSGYPEPGDPFLHEQIEPRSGTNPATGIAISPPNAGYLANPINGHEWSIVDESELQYSCTFRLPESIACPTREDAVLQREQGLAVRPCDCTDLGGDDFQNPLCQDPNGTFGLTQHFGKAFPPLRQLTVLRDFGNNSILGSICPKSIDPSSADFAYRPFVDALVARFAEVFGPR